MVDYNAPNPLVPNFREYFHCNMGSDTSRSYGNYDLNENERSEFCRGYGNRQLQGVEVDVEQMLGAQAPFMRCNDIQQETGSNELQQDNQIITIVDEPFVGMEFNSHQEAYHFYNAYARSIGFSTRIGGTYRSRVDDSIISREYFCSKEGFGRRSNNEESTRPRVITREGCKAKLVIKIRNNKWLVTAFEENHNHELAPPSKVHLLRSHKRNSCSPGILSNNILGSPSTNPTNISNILPPASRGIENVMQSNLSVLGIDCHALLNYFKSIQSRNPTFFYAIQFDRDYALSGIFWVDARCRSSYNFFYDVILVDTTYKKNRQCMPFVSIIGVNNHRQSIPFGCALISDESELTYIWLLETWLQAMNYQHPVLIITDEDSALKTAVAKVLPETLHRFCKWRILENILEKLGHMTHAYSNICQEMEDIVNCSSTPEDFEKDWQSFVERYNLEENDWLQSLYVDRHCWVPAYVKDTFFAGLSTIERDERIKLVFQGHILSKTTLNAFFRQHEKAIENQYEKEMQEEFNVLNNNPVLRTPIPMEQQASKVYTRKIFSLFQEEIVQSLALFAKNIGDNGSISTYVVRKYGMNHDGYTILFNNVNHEGECSCRKFNHEGIVCRHILAVFQKLDIFELAPCYILKRWTIDAKKANEPDERIFGHYSLDNITCRYNNLYQDAMKCIELGAFSLEKYHLALQGLRELFEKLLNGSSNKPQTATMKNGADSNVAMLDPPVSKSKDPPPTDVIHTKSSVKSSKRTRKRGNKDS